MYSLKNTHILRVRSKLAFFFLTNKVDHHDLFKFFSKRLHLLSPGHVDQ